MVEETQSWDEDILKKEETEGSGDPAAEQEPTVEEKEGDYLTEAKPGRLMAKFAIPTVISLVVAALYNIVDQIFIANASYLGSYGNAANTVIYPFTVIALAVALMFGDGCCSLVSISLGAKRKDDAKRCIGSTVIMVVACSILMMIIYLVFQDWLIIAFGGDVNDETFAFAKEYFLYISIGLPFYMFGQAMSSIIRSDGSPGYSMVMLVVGAVINIILDPIFIFVCEWGMMGAAIATVAGQVFAAVMAFIYMFRFKQVKLDRDAFRIRIGIVGKTAYLGVSSFLGQISVVISMLAVLNMIKKYALIDEIFGQIVVVDGVETQPYAQIPSAIFGIVMKFYSIVLSTAIGLAAGCIPVVGYNLGAERPDRAKKMFYLILLWEAIVGVVFLLVYMLLPKQLLLIFGAANESEYYMEFGVQCIRIVLCTLPFTCINKGAFIYLQALGKAKESSILSIIREVVFGAGLPLLLPLLMPASYKLYGILWFMPLADTLTLIICVFVIVRTIRQLNRMPVAKRSGQNGERAELIE